MRAARNIMADGLRLGTLFGIPVTLSWSFFPIAFLILVQFSLGLGLVVGVVAVAGLYASVVAHEYGHALTARAYGIRTQSIALHLFGGVAKIVREPRRPIEEFLIAVAGPAVSLVLAVGFGLVAAGLAAAGGPVALFEATRVLAVINGFLGVFNLLPGYPMDGGRVLRAWLWHRSGNLRRASWQAARAGEFVAYGLMGAGVLGFIGVLPVFGLMTAFVGWFLLMLARGEKARATHHPHTYGSTGSASPFATQDPVVVGPLRRGDVEYIVRYPDGREVTYRQRN